MRNSEHIYAGVLLLLFVAIVAGGPVPQPSLIRNTNRLPQNAGKVQICGNHVGQHGYLRTMTCAGFQLLLPTVEFELTNNHGGPNYIEPLVLTQHGIFEYADFHGRQINAPDASARGAIQPNNDGCFTIYMQRVPNRALTAISPTHTRCDLNVVYVRTSTVVHEATADTTIAVIEQRRMKVINKGREFFSDAFTYYFEGEGFPNMFPDLPNHGQYINYIDNGVLATGAGTARTTSAAGTGDGGTGPGAIAAVPSRITIANRHQTNTGVFQMGAATPANNPVLVASVNQVYLRSFNLVAGTITSTSTLIPVANGGDPTTDTVVRCLIYYSSDSVVKCRRAGIVVTPGVDTAALQQQRVNDDDDLFLDTTILTAGDSIIFAGSVSVGGDAITVPTNGEFAHAIERVIPTITPATLVGNDRYLIPQNADEITIRGRNFVPEYLDNYFIRFGFAAAGAEGCQNGANVLSWSPVRHGAGAVVGAANILDYVVTADPDGGHAAGIALDYDWGSFNKAAIPRVCTPLRINKLGTELVCKLLIRFPNCHAEGCGVPVGVAGDGCITPVPAAGANSAAATLQAVIQTGISPSSSTAAQEIGRVLYVEPKVTANAVKLSYASIISVTITGQGFDINHYQFNRFPLQLHEGSRFDRSAYCSEAQRVTVNSQGYIFRDPGPALLFPNDVGRPVATANLNPTTNSGSPVGGPPPAQATDNIQTFIGLADQCIETHPAATTTYHAADAQSRNGGATRCAALDRSGTKLVCHFAPPTGPGRTVDLAQEPELQVASPLFNFAPGVVSSSNPYYEGANFATYQRSSTVLPGIAALMPYANLAGRVSWAMSTPVATQGVVINDVLEHRGAVAVVVAGAVGGDPHFFGLMGESFFFNGVTGKIYSILSDENIQLNGKLQLYHWNHGEATVFRSVGLKYNGNNLLIDAGSNNVAGPEASVTLNGVAIHPNATKTYELGLGGSVHWSAVHTNTKHLKLSQFNHNVIGSVSVETAEYEFQFALVEEGRDVNGMWKKQPRRFIDFTMKVATNNIRPHGVLGQTATPNKKRSVEGKFEIEGAEEDYEVSHMFAHDSKFNKFLN